MTPIEFRAATAQKALDKFKGFAFRPGVRDCVKMSLFHLRNMGWTLTGKKLEYRSIAAGEKLLKAYGWNTLADALDELGFERIPPAAAAVADIVEMQGEDGPGTLSIALGNGRVIGYHQDAAGAVVMQPDSPIAAWRIPVNKSHVRLALRKNAA